MKYEITFKYIDVSEEYRVLSEEYIKLLTDSLDYLSNIPEDLKKEINGMEVKLNKIDERLQQLKKLNQLIDKKESLEELGIDLEKDNFTQDIERLYLRELENGEQEPKVEIHTHIIKIVYPYSLETISNNNILKNTRKIKEILKNGAKYLLEFEHEVHFYNSADDLFEDNKIEGINNSCLWLVNTKGELIRYINLPTTQQNCLCEEREPEEQIKKLEEEREEI